MILYVNGDSHSAGAELVHCIDGKLLIFKEDDSSYWPIVGTIEGRAPHPECIKLSYGQKLADQLGYDFVCDAQSASSNDRIVRTTYEYLTGVQGMFNNRKPDLIVIGWSTWEREEWWDPETNRYWQVNAGGIGHDWPENIKRRYKDYIINMDIQAAMHRTFSKIWTLHTDLQKQKIDHLFFNCFEPLSGMPDVDWEGCYLEPYDPEFTYCNWLRAQGFKTVTPESFHFGTDSHRAWAQFLYQNLVQRNLTQ